MLRVPDQDDHEDEEQKSAGFVLKLPEEPEESVGTGMIPDFDWSEEEQVEIQEALEATDAWQRYLDEGPETMGLDGNSSKLWHSDTDQENGHEDNPRQLKSTKK